MTEIPQSIDNVSGGNNHSEPDTVCLLSSGSKGNCAFVRLDGTELLIDVGISSRRITSELSRLGSDPSRLSGILLTHEHCDHTSGLAIFTKHTAAPVWFPEQCSTYLRAKIKRGDPCPIAPRSSFTVGTLSIESFWTPHDSRGSVGYIIRSNSHTLGYCTDLGELTPDILARLSDCDSLVIESNHDSEMLEYGPYPASLKARIRSRFGHLSNDASARAVAELAGMGLKNVMLAHLSEENNLPELALAACEQSLAKEGRAINVKLASPYHPEWLIGGGS